MRISTAVSSPLIFDDTPSGTDGVSLCPRPAARSCSSHAGPMPSRGRAYEVDGLDRRGGSREHGHCRRLLPLVPAQMPAKRGLQEFGYFHGSPAARVNGDDGQGHDAHLNFGRMRSTR